MSPARLSVALFAAASFACSTAAVAAPSPDGGTAVQPPPSAPPRPGDPFDPALPHTQRKPTSAKLFERLSQAKVQIPEAVSIATAAVDGGVPVRATRRTSANGDFYEIAILAGEHERVVKIAASNGSIVENTRTDLQPARRATLDLLRPKLAQAKLTLGAAAAPALAKFGDGRVLAMTSLLKDDLLRYEVAVIGADRLASYLVDPMTGEARPAVEEAQRPTENPYVRAFDQDKAGPPPAEWKVEGTRQSGPLATWAVVADPSAPTPPNALALTASEHGSDSTYNLCWSNTLRFQDGRISLAFKPVGGVDDEGGGVMWRVKDKDNYYIVRANPAEENFRVYVVKEGVRKQLATAKVAAKSGAWHTIVVTHDGDRIECFLDGLKQLAVNDATLPGEGGVGFWTKADATTAFDDLRIEPKRTLAEPEAWEKPVEGAATGPNPNSGGTTSPAGAGSATPPAQPTAQPTGPERK